MNRMLTCSRVRPIDCGPADILRSDGVCRTSESADHATERASRGPVRLRDVPTYRTGSGRVTRIDGHYGHAVASSLVLDEETQLVESPRVEDTTLGPTNRNPIADACKVFDGDSSISVFGLRDQPLADDVVHVTSKSGFYPLALLEKAFGGLGSFLLQTVPQDGMPSSQSVQVTPTMSISIGIGGDVDNAEIDSEKVLYAYSFRFVDLVDDHQVERAVPVDERSTVGSGTVEGTVRDDRDLLTAVERQDTDGVAFPRQCPLIVRDPGEGLEERLLRLVAFVGTCHLGDGSDRKLCRETEHIADLVIDFLLERPLVGRLVCEGFRSNGVAGSINLLHGRLESSLLRSRGSEFELEREFHADSISTFLWRCNYRRFLPGLKSGASSAEEL